MLDLAKRVAVGEELERLLERLEVVGADQHGGGATVAGEQDPLVLALHAIDDLREPDKREP